MPKTTMTTMTIIDDYDDYHSDSVTMCVIAGEECRNGTICKGANTGSTVNGTPRMPLSNNEILFGINSSPPWYLVVAYALQVRVLSFSQLSYFSLRLFVERSIIQFIIIANRVH